MSQAVHHHPPRACIISSSFSLQLMLASRQVPKRVSAVSFSTRGDHAFFADKFGDVHAARASGLQATDALTNGVLPPTRLNRGGTKALTLFNRHLQSSGLQLLSLRLCAKKGGQSMLSCVCAHAESAPCTAGQPALLLGHFCSIITSLNVSKDGKYVVTTDRDNKVRVSSIPDNPLQACPLNACLINLWLLPLV